MNNITPKINHIQIITIHLILTMVKNFLKTQNQILLEPIIMLYPRFHHLDLTPVLKIILKQIETMAFL